MPSTQDAGGDPRATKRGVRTRLRARRRDIAADRDLAADGTALAHLALGEIERLCADTPASEITITAYQALPGEPDVGALLSEAYSMGMRVLVPITLPDLDLDWARWTPAGLGPALGTAAVAEVAVAFIPGLAVDGTGTRLGQGGGCYDRVLPRLAAGTPVICVLHPGEVLAGESLPAEPHDARVDAVLTAAGVRWVAPGVT